MSPARPHIWIDPPTPDGPPAAASGSPLVDALLLARGVTDAADIRAWLDTSARAAPEPTVFPNMEAAIARTVRAIEGGERIGIFGDYDADGITSTAILTLALRAATGGSEDRVACRLPERAEGYGLSVAAVDDLAAGGSSLAIVVDCGSNDLPALDRARERELDVIVLDHHRLTGEPREGDLIVNPQLRADGVGQELTGAGLAYCFVVGLAHHGVPVHVDDGERAYLDLAAIGTIVDMGRLTGFNRTLARDGIARLRRTRRPGLLALMSSAGCTPATIDAGEISFKLGPRLNAPGRVASPRVALDLLLTDDPAIAVSLAAKIEGHNEDRKAITTKILAKAIAQVEQGIADGDPIAVAHDPDWPAGIVGVIAGRLAELYGMPAIVLTDGPDGLSVGSARSIDGFDLFRSLSEHRALIARFGGHAQAAGLSVATPSLSPLVDALIDDILASGIAIPAPIEHRIDLDLTPAELTLETIRVAQRLAPFGKGNPEPLYRVRGARVRSVSRMGPDKSHLKLEVEAPGGGVKAVMFGAGDREADLARRPSVDLLGTLEIDTWRGIARANLKLVDFGTAE